MIDSNYYIEKVSLTLPTNAVGFGKTRGLKTYFIPLCPNKFILKGGGKYYTIGFKNLTPDKDVYSDYDELNAYIDFIKPFIVWDLIL